MPTRGSRLLPLLLLAGACAASAPAGAASLHSGLYEALTLAVAPSGQIKGRYHEVQGEGVTKTCAFSFKGHATPGGKAAITAWSDAGGQQLHGTLAAAQDGGLSLTLPHARDLPGCGLVLLPTVDQGLDLDHVASGTWTDLVKVTAPKTALQPAAGAVTGRSYVVRGDVLGVIGRQGGQLQVVYPSDRPHPSQGWIDPKAVAPIG